MISQHANRKFLHDWHEVKNSGLTICSFQLFVEGLVLVFLLLSGRWPYGKE